MYAAILLLFLAAVRFGPGGRFQLEENRDSFGTRSHGIIEAQASGRSRFYPLPQSTVAEYTRLRPEDVRINPLAATSNHYDREEVIGPYQIEDGRIWFGNNYYDSEGMRGVGAFGYFDTATRSYTLFSPPEVARYEIGAILVERDAVWLALDQFIEDISKVPGGLMRWDRATHAVRKYPLEFVVDRIERTADALRLETHDGYALFRDGGLRLFLAGGKPIAKFPPPPTHY